VTCQRHSLYVPCRFWRRLLIAARGGWPGTE
jgi:hypothetical protein